MTPAELIEETDPTTLAASAVIVKGFRDFVEYDDVVQELRFWVLKHADKVTEWINDEDEDERKAWPKKLFKSLTRAGNAYARNEKAARTGYRVEDEWFANRKVIRELLPVVLAGGEDGYEARVQAEGSGNADPAEGNNRAAMLADVQSAWLALKGGQNVSTLAWLYGEDLTHAQTAEVVGVSETTIRNRERRAIDKMIEHLGGTALDAGL